LLCFEERIVIDGDMLDPHELQDLVDTVRSTEVELTYFEFATAMALVHFSRRSVDIALLEVGLGGRWDATNATTPMVSVITSIAFDHEEWLGQTVEKIALEKAMIMRRGCPLVMNGTAAAALETVLREAGSCGSIPVVRGKDFSVSREEPDDTIRFDGRRWNLSGISLGLAGAFQVENAATSLAGLECLDERGFPIPESAIREGMAAARWPGRFQDMGGTPRILVDSAHNPAAARSLVQALGETGEVVWLFSALRDKDVEGMAVEMLRAGNRFVLVPLLHPRACVVGEMAERMPTGARIIMAASVGEGLESAVSLAGRTGTVVVAGSVFLAASVLEEKKAAGWSEE
jgi:dihydrofolate synthase/folylpolyglutamate synthase